MEKIIKGTRTEQNLLKAFAGESQARSRYVFFSSKAKKEGYEQIAGVFAETAEQEKEHAERFFKFLEGGDVEITASYPTGPIGTTAENLLAAAKGENEEWDVLYREFAKVADEEGFAEIAAAFRMISIVEAEHERRYLKLLSRLTDGNFLTAVSSSRPRRLRSSARRASTRRPTSSPRRRTIDRSRPRPSSPVSCEGSGAFVAACVRDGKYSACGAGNIRPAGRENPEFLRIFAQL